MEKHRIHYLDLLRVSATFAVILIHAASQQPFYAKNIHTLSWMGVNFWDAISRWSVPIFVMISGALFLDPKRKITVKHLFTKNIWRIVTAFIFWDIFYTAYCYFFEGYSKMATLGVLVKGYTHLWFLPMIIGLYLIVPFLRKITANIGLTRYFLVLAAFFSVFLTTFFGTYGDVSAHYHMPVVVQTIMNSLYRLNINTHFNFTLSFPTYFVAGYYLSQLKLSRKNRYWIYGFGIFGLIWSFGATQWLSMKFNTPILPFYQYMSIPVALTSVAIFVAMKELGLKIDWVKDNAFKKALLKTSELTFGIYLIHFMFVHIAVRNCHIFELIPNTFIAVPVMSIIIFIISGLLAWGLSYVPWANKRLM